MLRLPWWFRTTRVAVAGALITLPAAPVAAQDTGSIPGVVVDNQDQIVPAATVTLDNARTTSVLSVTTNTPAELAFQAKELIASARNRVPSFEPGP